MPMRRFKATTSTVAGENSFVIGNKKNRNKWKKSNQMFVERFVRIDSSLQKLTNVVDELKERQEEFNRNILDQVISHDEAIRRFNDPKCRLTSFSVGNQVNFVKFLHTVRLDKNRTFLNTSLYALSRDQ